MKMERFLLLLFAASVLAGCQSKSVAGQAVDVAGGSYQDVTPEELDAMLGD